MADTTAEEAESPEEGSSKKGLIIGVVLALVGAGGGFFVTSSGMLGGGEKSDSKPVEIKGPSDIAFVAIDPITVAVGNPADRRFLRFRAQLEVPTAYQAEVEGLLPRIVDVLNTYLRSVTMADVEHPAALLTLRAQLRRRLDLVVGGDRINDLLVMEFVVN